nr:ATP-dependent RNA helicase DDX24 isoform X2 [Parasteatoda tepidariorum]
MNKWKQVAIDTSQLDPSELEQFGGIEELSDYEILRPGSKKSDQKGKKLKKKKGKKFKSSEEIPLQSIKAKKSKLDMSAWNGLKIPISVLSAMEELRFTQPTEIQSQSIPAILNNKDVFGAAETGSGKTLAFGLPIIKNIISIKESKKEQGIEDKQLYSLILTPTRELAIQIKKHLQAVCKYTDLLISSVVGGMAAEKQKRILKKCPDIIVATPGRLWEMLQEGERHINKIPNVRYLVIDEADRMAEKGHFAELTQILEVINGNKENKKLHKYVFSATLSMEIPDLKIKKKKHKLKSMIKLIGLKDPVVIDLTNKKAVAGTLIESQLVCKNEEKDAYLYYFLTMYPGRTLVFSNSIDCVRRLRSVLEYLNCDPLPLHASMHQRQRLKNLEKFEKSNTGILLATDVAARGLDIKEIQHVIHYQVPRTAETYVHRSGRTARAKNEGLSLMMIEPQEAVFYKRICKTLNKGLEQ